MPEQDEKTSWREIGENFMAGLRALKRGYEYQKKSISMKDLLENLDSETKSRILETQKTENAKFLGGKHTFSLKGEKVCLTSEGYYQRLEDEKYFRRKLIREINVSELSKTDKEIQDMLKSIQKEPLTAPIDKLESEE